MAYYSGQVASYQELLDVLVASCVAQGYSYSNGLIQKNGFGIRIALNASYGMQLRAGTVQAGSLVNMSPTEVYVSGVTGLPSVVFPVSYFLFIFETEVYLIFKHSINTYIWLTFGMTVNNVWVSAPRKEVLHSSWPKISINSKGGSGTYCSHAPFWHNSTWYAGTGFNHWCYDSILGWNPDNTMGSILGINCKYPLVERLPSKWNTESILLSISIYAVRSSSKYSLILDLENSRFLRIDHHEPEEIIQLGSEKWMVFPFYKKNSASRDGGDGIDHTGTFGWAIRYDGP